jgi:hypothetical protein
MIDFTLHIYKELLKQIKNYNYQPLTFAEYIKQKCSGSNSHHSIVILRHDVDKLLMNSLITAQIEYELDIKGTYYFRMLPHLFNTDIINKIASLGHEIGYHYETMDTSWGSIDKAYEEFCRNLDKFRSIYPVETICMHGSPLSKYDNKAIWNKYDYRISGIIGEPYFDIDFSEFAYLTDTGRRWNSLNVSVRDKVKSKYNFNFRSTYDIINNMRSLPEKIMFTIHPQRWSNPGVFWLNELFIQNIKNIMKYTIVKWRR